MSKPFPISESTSGRGIIHLALLATSVPRLRKLEYQYPLKLIAPGPSTTTGDHPRVVHTVYLLTYGGGLVAGDSIDLHVMLEAHTRLSLLTQGSTKLFKSPGQDVTSRQVMSVDLEPGSALCYLPDPVQPFKDSCFEQRAEYNVRLPEASQGVDVGSLCALDWVSSGRPANGEHWSFHRYASRNEIYTVGGDHNRRRLLLLRDSIVLDAHGGIQDLAVRMDRMAVSGTLVLYGPVFSSLGRFFLDEFARLPRIGGRQWDTTGDEVSKEPDHAARWRKSRQQQENDRHLLWSASSIRGCVVVKMGATRVEYGREWLRSMLSQEGTVNRHFGERAMLCLR